VVGAYLNPPPDRNFLGTRSGLLVPISSLLPGVSRSARSAKPKALFVLGVTSGVGNLYNFWPSMDYSD